MSIAQKISARSIETSANARISSQQVFQACESLRNQPELLQLLLASVRGVLWSTDLSLHFTSVLSFGDADIGWHPQMIAGASLESCYGSGHPLATAHAKAIAGEAGELEIENADRIFQVRIRPLQSPEGTVAGCLGLALDVTEQKLAERQRDQLFDISLDVLVVANQEGYFLKVNRALERLVGYSRDELTSRPFFEFVHPEDRENTLRVVKSLSGSDLVYFENRYCCKDGSIRWLAWTCPAAHPDDKLLYASARDITEWKQDKEKQQRLTTELERSNTDLEQFAYVASHDLQEPLRAVAGCVQVFQRRYQASLDSRADELIQHTIDGVKRMEALINDLLAYSRVARKSPEFGTANLEFVLEQVLANLQTSVRETEAVVTHDPLPTITADAGQMSQLLQNLIANALKFRGQATPEIHVGAERKKGEWLFSVRDNGIGMQKEYFDRIFVLFQRLHTRVEYPGTGIGLSICKKIAERHGGKIWVESELGVGTSFFFTILDRDCPR